MTIATEGTRWEVVRNASGKGNMFGTLPPAVLTSGRTVCASDDRVPPRRATANRQGVKPRFQTNENTKTTSKLFLNDRILARPQVPISSRAFSTRTLAQRSAPPGDSSGEGRLGSWIGYGGQGQLAARIELRGGRGVPGRGSCAKALREERPRRPWPSRGQHDTPRYERKWFRHFGESEEV